MIGGQHRGYPVGEHLAADVAQQRRHRQSADAGESVVVPCEPGAGWNGLQALDHVGDNYLGGNLEQADGYAFPGHATDLTGTPPIYIENCELDDLRPSGEPFARQLSNAGVEVELATAAGVPHGHLSAVGSPLAAASLRGWSPT
jgi:acetyl esterase/lipase